MPTRRQPALRRPPTIAAFPGFANIGAGITPTAAALKVCRRIGSGGFVRPAPAWVLPTGLAQAGHVATHGGFAQLVAAEVELGVHGARTAGQRATGALAGRAGVARQLLQLALRFHLLLVGGGGAQHDRLQFGALGGVLLDELGPLDVAVDHRGLCHVFLSRYQLRNGKLKASSSALASASVFAVVVMAMSMPRIASTASKSISGKMICSLMPKLKLPRPSKARPETPRKSRTRGSEMLIRRSRNSNICARRRVTLQPIGQPSRILNEATETRALVVIGFWPEILAMSATAFSRIFLLPAASPTPMFSVILVMRGTCITFW